MDPKYDSLFKALVTISWTERDDGDVEASSGYFALIHIEAGKAYKDSLEEELGVLLQEDFIMPDPGWYVSKELNTGIIYVYDCHSKTRAVAEYEATLDEYIKWCDDDDD
jgi:hypothetical protein